MDNKVKEVFQKLIDRAHQFRMWTIGNTIRPGNYNEYAKYVGTGITEECNQTERALLETLTSDDINERRFVDITLMEGHGRPKEPIKRIRKSVYSFKD